MADSLVLKGYNDVRNQTGSEMTLLTSKGRYAQSLTPYEDISENCRTYVTGSRFQVTQGGDNVFLVLDTNSDSEIRIDVGASFAFTFYNPKQIKSAALLDDSGEMIERYEFGQVPGVGTKTITGTGSRP